MKKYLCHMCTFVRLPQMVSAQRCPQGWTFHGGRCYVLSSEHKATWSTANRACREKYGCVVVVVVERNSKTKACTNILLQVSCHTRELHNLIVVLHKLKTQISLLFFFRYKGTLASVFSKADMDWLWDFSGRKPFWIGECLLLVLVLSACCFFQPNKKCTNLNFGKST